MGLFLFDEVEVVDDKSNAQIKDDDFANENEQHENNCRKQVFIDYGLVVDSVAVDALKLILGKIVAQNDFQNQEHPVEDVVEIGAGAEPVGIPIETGVLIRKAIVIAKAKGSLVKLNENYGHHPYKQSSNNNESSEHRNNLKKHISDQN